MQTPRHFPYQLHRINRRAKANKFVFAYFSIVGNRDLGGAHAISSTLSVPNINQTYSVHTNSESGPEEDKETEKSLHMKLWMPNPFVFVVVVVVCHTLFDSSRENLSNIIISHLKLK